MRASILGYSYQRLAPDTRAGFCFTNSLSLTFNSIRKLAAIHAKHLKTETAAELTWPGSRGTVRRVLNYRSRQGTQECAPNIRAGPYIQTPRLQAHCGIVIWKMLMDAARC